VNTLAEISNRTLKTIATLEANFQRRVRQWLDEMVQTGIRPLIYCGFRSFEEQLALFAQGRTKPGRIVTKAKPGESYHNYGLAFDWVPVKPTAKDPKLFSADWNDATAYKVGEQCGHTFDLASISWETGHLQDDRYKTWRDIPGNQNTRVSKLNLNLNPNRTRRVQVRKP
jgi:hypothetical protein